MLSTILWARGFETQASAHPFLNPRLDGLKSPFTLHNMQSAGVRLAHAVLNNENIVVYADYDMDGMSGLALLCSFLRTCGATNVSSYQPHRFDEGYGVHPKSIEELADRGVKVIISVDTGISAFEAATKAKERGVDLIITDHHLQIGDDLPDTPYIINPNQKADLSGLNYLSGVGVAFYLAIALRSLLRQEGWFGDERTEPDLRKWLDLYVLGTLADHVDLVGDNRVLVRSGLVELQGTQRAGLKTLVQRALFGATRISARDVVFSVTPKLNAASRMGKAEISTELLLCEDATRAEALCDLLFSLNEQRSQIQGKVFDEAFQQAKEQYDADPELPIIVVHGDWHEGVLGVVAAKLVEKFRKPSIVLTLLKEKEALRGSMRTITPVSCVKALDACRDLLEKYGGHTMAAGLQVKAKSLGDFFDRVRSQTKAFLDFVAHQETIEYDADLDKGCLTVEEIETLQLLAPWGSGNPEPLFKLTNIDMESAEILKGQHLKCQLPGGISMIGFFKADDLERLRAQGTRFFDALVTPEINRFRGQKNVQLKIQYVRPGEPENSIS